METQREERRVHLLKWYEHVLDYKVKHGDSLMSICLKHNINSKAVRNANPHIAETLIEGDLLLLPVGTKKESLSNSGSFEHLQMLPSE